MSAENPIQLEDEDGDDVIDGAVSAGILDDADQTNPELLDNASDSSSSYDYTGPFDRGAKTFLPNDAFQEGNILWLDRWEACNGPQYKDYNLDKGIFQHPVVVLQHHHNNINVLVYIVRIAPVSYPYIITKETLLTLHRSPLSSHHLMAISCRNAV